MHPTLLPLSMFGHALAIDTRGLCLALGAIAGLGVALRLGHARGLPRADLRDLGLELVLVGVVAARLGWVALHARTYALACRTAVDAGEGVIAGRTRALWIGEGGLSFYVGLLVALAWLAWRAPRRGLDARALTDVAAPGLALGYAFAAVGAFFAGAGFGHPTRSPLGVRFPPESLAFQVLFDRGYLTGAATQTPPLHPVQLEDALLHLVLFAALAWLARRGAPARGRLLALFVVGHALARLALWPLTDGGG